jgi:hypothetical protein
MPSGQMPLFAPKEVIMEPIEASFQIIPVYTNPLARPDPRPYHWDLSCFPVWPNTVEATEKTRAFSIASFLPKCVAREEGRPCLSR